MKIDLLRALYNIHAPSYKEKRMRDFLKKEVVKRNATYTQDPFGNLLIVKGDADSYPCVVAHMDQVQRFHPIGFRTIIIDDVIIGWSDKDLCQCGLGADDKNGIFIALNCLERFDAIKVAFFVREEVGCIGSSQVDLSFFTDCRYIIEPDRRGAQDLITSMCGVPVCNEDFVRSFDYHSFGYRQTEGSVTDVLELVERGVGLSCINLSCGYYHPHTDYEVTVLKELENCQDLVFHIIENCLGTYPFLREYTQDETDFNWWGEWQDYIINNK